MYRLLITLFFLSHLIALGQTDTTVQPLGKSKSIVFIHGLFQNPESWSQWKAYFEAKGYRCYTPAYPYHGGKPEALRKSIDPKLGKLRLQTVVDSLSKFIDGLPEKPILIGHSMGGLIVQKLVEQDKATLGVCISPAPPKGIFSFKWSFLKANLSTINVLKGNSVCLPSVKWFQYAFCNTMNLLQTQEEYDAYVVPESRNIPRSSTGKQGKVNFKKTHVPLLFVTGKEDHIIPSSLVEKNFKAYKDSSGKKELKIFEGRTHYICGQPQWEEVADYISTWIDGQ